MCLLPWNLQSSGQLWKWQQALQRKEGLSHFSQHNQHLHWGQGKDDTRSRGTCDAGLRDRSWPHCWEGCYQGVDSNRASKRNKCLLSRTHTRLHRRTTACGWDHVFFLHCLFLRCSTLRLLPYKWGSLNTAWHCGENQIWQYLWKYLEL